MTLEDESRNLSSAGPAVFPLGLACMGMSGMYVKTDDNESIATIHAALDYGVTLLDTGDFNGMGHNEILIGRALKYRRSKALVKLSATDLARIEMAIPEPAVAGTRYDEHRMKVLDSEQVAGSIH